MTPQHIEPIEMAPDKLEAHYRQQLSAMMDGALAPDQARFLLRRLQHDRELCECWERWQLCGEVMRGRTNVLLPHDFAHRVAAAIASDNATEAVGRSIQVRRWAGWGGGAALAASVALVALLIARQEPRFPGRQPAVSEIVATPSSSAPVAPTPRAVAPVRSASQAMADTRVAVATVAEVPRRASQRRSRGQTERAASRDPQLAADAPVVGLVGGDAMDAAPGLADPFATQPPSPPSRPWPRAVLPTNTVIGAFNAGYASPALPSSFHPFEPRLSPPGGDDGDHIP